MTWLFERSTEDECRYHKSKEAVYFNSKCRNTRKGKAVGFLLAELRVQINKLKKKK